jgi:tetratricopeptide (TPR) repeat protein
MLLGIPPGRDMDGRPLTHILEKPVDIEPIGSWDEKPGDAGMHPAELRIDPVSAQATIDHLVSLGYLEASAADSQNAPRTAMDEADLNLAVVYMNSMRPAMAIPVLERLVQSYPNNGRYALTLASAYGYAGRAKDGRTVLESLEQRGFRGPELDTMMGAALYDMGEMDAALTRLRTAQALAPEAATIDATIARIYIARCEWREAEAVYRRMLTADPESPMAHDGLAGVLLELKDFDNAASHALDALQVAYHFPMAHFHLGLAFEGMGELSRAIKAQEFAVSIAPGFVEAHRRLVAMYERTGDPVRALTHERAAAGHMPGRDQP